MRTMIMALAAALVLPGAAAAGEPVTLPPWMAGAWALADEAGGWTEEFWTHPRAGLMIGASRAGEGEALRSWEAMRIQRKADGTVAFIAMPNGGAPVEFAMVRQDATSIEFANPSHDYPQRIRYWRAGDKLGAEISLLNGERAVSWTFAPMDD